MLTTELAAALPFYETVLSNFDTEQHDGVAWKVFYVVAPDGLCYWFGERQAG